MQVLPDGSRVVVRHCWTEMGQGMNTVAMQVACTELGLPPSAVVVSVDCGDENVEQRRPPDRRGVAKPARRLAGVDASAELRLELEVETTGGPDLMVDFSKPRTRA